MKIELLAKPDLEKYSPTQQILINRGIQLDNIVAFLEASLGDIHPQGLLEEIEEGANLYLSHVTRTDSKILVQIDCDVDGYTSGAEIVNYTNENFPNAEVRYQVHGDKTHGLIETENTEWAELIIIPDAGSNQYDLHKKLKAQGKDILILDHHDAEKISDDAIVVNNQLSPNYPNKSLCGAGVVFQFLREVERIGEYSIKKPALAFIDLVAVGLVADMSDLKNIETKALITEGLGNLNESLSSNNKFIQELVNSQSYSLKGSVTPIGIAFYIAPLINAVVRVGTMEERDQLFAAMIDRLADEEVPSTKRGCKGEFETLKVQMTRTIKNVKNRQTREQDKFLESLLPQITSESLEESPIIVLDTKGKIGKNLNGLIANKIANKYQRPTIVLGRYEDKPYGSARNYVTPGIPDLKDFVKTSGFVEMAEGHGNAFGIGFESMDKVKDLRAYAAKEVSTEDMEVSYKVDYCFNANDQNMVEILKDIASMENYWGTGMPQPLIAIKNIVISENDVILMSPGKNPTLKLKTGSVDCIKFRSSITEYESFAPTSDGKLLKINVVGTCSLNEWQGNVTVQLLIKDIETLGYHWKF